MTATWFYMRAGQIVGPLTAAQLREHALANKVAAADHVRRGGDGNWLPAVKVKGLFDAQAERSPPVVLPPPQSQAAPMESPQPMAQPLAAPARQPQPASAPRGPSVPLGWVVAGLVALIGVFGFVYVNQQGRDSTTPNYNSSPDPERADQSQDKLLKEAEERTRLEKERLQVAEEQKRLAEEQLKASKRMADEQYVRNEVESKRQELRAINEKARRDAIRLGIDPSTVPMLDEASIIGEYERQLRKARGLD